MQTLRNTFKFGKTELSRIELLEYISPIDSTMLTDEDMQAFTEEMDKLVDKDRGIERWWSIAEDLAINKYNMRHYDNYSRRERREADKRISQIS